MSLLKQDVIAVVVQQEKTANAFGLSWDNIDQVLEQIHSECDEVKQAWTNGDQENLKEEIGDLVNATISLAVFCQLNPVEVLAENNTKFQKRFDTVVALVKADGLESLHGQPLETLLGYWNKAKEIA
jgi:uncharacterized protein YabN with tetrapyrrole methylase and pyrophosphatase domain